MKRSTKKEKKTNLAELSNLQKKYMDEYKEQNKFFDSELLEITELDELERFQKRASKTLLVLKNRYEEIQAYAEVFAPKHSSPSKTQIEFKAAKPDSKAFYEQINQRKQEIKTKRDPAKILKRLNEHFHANTFDMQAYNEFLINPAVKNKIRFNPIFASRVEKLNKQVITGYANSIAALDQKLFLQISTDELFSPPWKPEECPSMAAFTDQNVNLTNYISSLVLNASSMEERTLIVDRWIWVAYSLYHEHKDLSGCQAILTGLSTTEVSRLKKTFDGLNPETEQVFAKLNETMFPHRATALGPVLSQQQAAIPSMALIRRDITFLEDGNRYLEKIKDPSERRLEMASRTSGGRKMMLTLNKLQTERTHFPIPNDTDAQLDTILIDMLNNGFFYDQDESHELSTQIEPLGNDLETAKPVNFGRVLKSSTSSNSSQPTIQRQMLEELIRDLNRYLIADVSRYLKDKKQSDVFVMDENYVIDWEKENSQLELLNREKEAHIETLEWLLKDEPKKSLVKEGNKLLQTLQDLDYKQLKMQNLEAKLFVNLYKLKIEFGTLSRLNPDPSNKQRLEDIETEVAKINELVETCELSPSLKTSLSAFNIEISTFRQLVNKAEEKQEEKENSEASIPDWRSNRSSQDHTSKNRYSLLYSQDNNAGKERESSVSELKDKKISSTEQRLQTMQKRYSLLYSQLHSQINRDTGKDKEVSVEPTFVAAHCP
ncbi:RasGEF domain-containing protein [Legionella sp.]|uniref:RasGEF domain-containing protein n=1 Tax=Legionella sp. TaxID=459 RepID=UPI000CB751A7|nr:RasGEF domain-containing protein [Legionella sp.]PJE13586.1 MAG: hypothetical protein CK430_06185 [Legionella sp.]